jgi:hypothetical protein
MTADVTPGVGPIDLPGLQIDWTPVPGRRYRAEGQVLFSANAANISFVLQLLMNGVTSGFYAVTQLVGAGDLRTAYGARVFSQSFTTAQSWKLRAIRQAGTGNIATSIDAANRPDFFRIEDVGPL